MAATGSIFWRESRAASTGCAMPLPDGPRPSGTTGPLTALEEAPVDVPELMVNGVVLEPVQYQWFADDRWDLLEVDNPAAVEIRRVLPDPDLVIEISTPIRPESATLYEYVELDDSGRPMGDAASTRDCLSDATCSFARHDESATIIFTQPRPGTILTLVLVYARATGWAEEPVKLMSSSWVVRVT